MPGLSLSPNRSRRSNRMCRLNARVHLSPEDAAAAERSFQMYCKPVELYNILQRRFEQNRYFLGRNLSYKIKGKQKKRLTTTVSVSSSSSMNKDELVQGIFPLYVLLASSISSGCHSAVFYCRTRAHVLESLSDFDDAGTGTGTGTGTTTAEASFVLPNKMNKLSSDESGSDQLFILLVSCGSRRNPLDDASSAPPTIGGYCLLGKIPVQSYISWDSVRTEHGSQMLATVEMHACFLESTTLDSSQSIAFKTPDCPVSMPVRVTILTREVGEKDPTPYSSFTHTASLTQFPRLRNANVVFNYKYYNNTLQETEATEDFACPFCLFKCASFMGIRCHLAASHDLFHYEFWVTEEYQAVNVSVKTDIWRSEIAANRFDPRLHTFFLCLKRLKRAASKHSSQNANHVLTSDHNLGSGEVTGNGLFNGLLEKGATTSSLPVPSTTNPLDRSDQAVQVYDNGTQSSRQMDKAQMAQNNNDLLNLSNGGANASVAECLELVATSPNVTGPSTATNQSSADLDCPSLVSERNLVPPPMLQFAKSRKLSADRSDPRNRMLLQKRLFFHSHRAQPMEMEQVLSDCDSEDEVDDDIADLEDRRMLDDFVDVTKDEKQMMHLWNSFVRRQRVLADGHIPWACEAFSKMHGPKLVESPPLLWCWRLFMIKLWNHSLLDGSTMDKCNTILSDFNNNSIDPPQS